MFGDKKLKQRARRLEERNKMLASSLEEANTKNVTLLNEKKNLEIQVRALTCQQMPITKLSVKLDPDERNRTFFILALRKWAIILPDGHKGIMLDYGRYIGVLFENKGRLHINRNSLKWDRYLSTSGSFVYTTEIENPGEDKQILIEANVEKGEYTFYGPFLNWVRSEGLLLEQITVPKEEGVTTSEKLREYLGMPAPQDPKVKILFE